MEEEVQIYVERGTEARSKGEENSSGWKFPCVEFGASRPVVSLLAPIASTRTFYALSSDFSSMAYSLGDRKRKKRNQLKGKITTRPRERGEKVIGGES